ncbi:MAG TPA: hypothetical protein VGG29_05560 [Caulobacteraceae bacterium]|jgi:hypothetical protein
MADAPVSFAADIRGVLLPYRDQMVWRLDLASYEDVKANAQIILPMITPPAQMPPTPFPAFPADFVAKFTAWMAQGCPP